MSASPAVTVLMPVYNAAAYLPGAIDSILAQTFGDFEFLAIDDGSTDASPQILAAYAERDPRIRLVRNAANMGLARSLNRGLGLARGNYIARMDADDISMPDRLAQQLAFMESHPPVGVCGAWVQKIGQRGGVERYPTDNVNIRCHLLFKDVLAHPTVMMRRTLFTRHGLAYDRVYEPADDYDLWVRATQHTDLANIPRVLLHYRMHEQQVGQRQRDIQDRAAKQIRLRQVRRLGLQPTDAEIATHEAISLSRFQPSRAFVAAAETWLRRLGAANTRTGHYSAPAFSGVLGVHWYTVCRLSTALGPWVYWTFWRSPLSLTAGGGLARQVKFGLMCLLRARSL